MRVQFYFHTCENLPAYLWRFMSARVQVFSVMYTGLAASFGKPESQPILKIEADSYNFVPCARPEAYIKSLIVSLQTACPDAIGGCQLAPRHRYANTRGRPGNTTFFSCFSAFLWYQLFVPKNVFPLPTIHFV